MTDPQSFTFLLDYIFNGSIEQRFDAAVHLHALLAPRLLTDATFTQRINELRLAAEQVNQQMAVMELGKLCPSCAADPRRGGCCSLYMAGETDALQLLLNMLAGVTVSMVRDDGRECRYLGGQGCILLFKPMFCLNYLCEHIQKECAPEQLAELAHRTGQLLQRQYALEQELLELLRKLPHPG